MLRERGKRWAILETGSWQATVHEIILFQTCTNFPMQETDDHASTISWYVSCQYALSDTCWGVSLAHLWAEKPWRFEGTDLLRKKCVCVLSKMVHSAKVLLGYNVFALKLSRHAEFWNASSAPSSAWYIRIFHSPKVVEFLQNFPLEGTIWT